MMKAYKYRIYPNRAQVAKLDATLVLCCELYNAALQERRDAWRICRQSVSCTDQQNQLPEIKQLRPELGMVHSQVLQDVLKRLDKAFDGFFRRVKKGEKPGFPRFRARARYDSFTYPQSGFALEAGSRRKPALRLSKIGRVKIKLHRPIAGKVKTLTIWLWGYRRFPQRRIEAASLWARSSHAVKPPSITRSAAVTKRLSSEAR